MLGVDRAFSNSHLSDGLRVDLERSPAHFYRKAIVELGNSSLKLSGELLLDRRAGVVQSNGIDDVHILREATGDDWLCVLSALKS